MGFLWFVFAVTSVPATYLFMATCSAQPAVSQFPNQAGMEATALAMEAWGLNHWDHQEVPYYLFDMSVSFTRPGSHLIFLPG